MIFHIKFKLQRWHIRFLRKCNECNKMVWPWQKAFGESLKHTTRKWHPTYRQCFVELISDKEEILS